MDVAAMTDTDSIWNKEDKLTIVVLKDGAEIGRLEMGDGGRCNLQEPWHFEWAWSKDGIVGPSPGPIVSRYRLWAHMTRTMSEEEKKRARGK
jgi:hypothetical protein